MKAGPTARLALAIFAAGLLGACDGGERGSAATTTERATSGTPSATDQQDRSALHIQPDGTVLFDGRPLPSCTLERCEMLPLDDTAPVDISAEPNTLAPSVIQLAQRLRATRSGAIGVCASVGSANGCDRSLMLGFPSQDAPDLVPVEIASSGIARHDGSVLGSCTRDDHDGCAALTRAVERLAPGRALGILVAPTLEWEDFARVVAALPDDRTIELLPVPVADSLPRPGKSAK
jgi:hypothetical protein